MSNAIKILLVEDDPLDADLEIAHLEADGFKCDWQRVQTQKDLIKALETERFDLLLIDYNLPGFDGLTALSIVNEFDLDVPVVFVTGNLKAELAIESIKAGAVDFVHKDRLTRLSSSVKRALNEFALRRADRIKNAELKFFRDLNNVANRGASFDELAKLLVERLPTVLKTEGISFYLRSFEHNSLVVYNVRHAFNSIERIEKLLNFSTPDLEIPLDEDNVYANCVREQQIKALDTPEAIKGSYELYLQIAKLPAVVEKRVRDALPKIIALLSLEKVVIFPMVAGEQVLGLLEIPYKDRIQGGDDIQRISAMIGQITAIFMRKRLEEEVSKLHDRQKMILDSAGEGIMGMDMDGRHIFVNPAAAHILGYSVDELLEKSNHTLYHHPHNGNDEFDRSTCPIYNPLRSASDSEAEHETVFVRKDGTSFPVSYTSSKMLKDGEEVGVVVAFRDITEQVENTRAIARLAQVVDQVQVSVGITDLDGRLVYVNPFFEKVSGYSQDELTGQNLHILKSGYQDDVFYDDLWQTISSGGTWQGRFINCNKNGEIYYEDSIIFPVKTPDGDAINYATVKREVSAEVQAQQQIERQLSRLEALHLTDATILSSMDLGLTIDVVLGEAKKELGLDATALLIFDPAQQSFSCLSRQGFKTDALEHTYLRLDEGLAGQAALTREIVHVDDLHTLKDRAPHLAQEEFKTYFGVPLVARGELKGVLEIFFRKEFSADDDWLGFLNALAGQAAIAIENAQLFDDLNQKNVDLASAYESTLEGWVRGLEIHDMETKGHSRRVVQMAVSLARRVGIAGTDLEHMRRGALLHDIGKLGVPKAILNKNGPLTPEERAIVEKHTDYGREMLANIPYLQPAIDITYSHHEKWDGTGYPLGLKGTAIPLFARIFAIVDVYDALIFDRPYRKAWDREKVLDYLQENSGSHFDPNVVDAFFDEFVFQKEAP